MDSEVPGTDTPYRDRNRDKFAPTPQGGTGKVSDGSGMLVNAPQSSGGVTLTGNSPDYNTRAGGNVVARATSDAVHISQRSDIGVGAQNSNVTSHVAQNSSGANLSNTQNSESYQSKDIGIKTAVQTNPFVRVEESKGKKWRKFLPHRKNSTVNNDENAVKNTTSEEKQPKKSVKIKLKLQKFWHFLFDGWHKFLTIPVVVVILVESVLLGLFVGGVFYNDTNTITEVQYPDFISEAKRIYNNADNINAFNDAVDYINSAIAAVEESGNLDRARNMRIQAYFFYRDIAQWNEAASVMANTIVDDIKDDYMLYSIYSMASEMYQYAGNYDAAKHYADVANRYADDADQPKIEIPDMSSTEELEDAEEEL